MEKSKFRLMLSGFLMIFLVSFANNSYAQGSANLAEKAAASSETLSSEMDDFFSDKETAKSNLNQAIGIYKNIAKTATAGSAVQVDAIARARAYGKAYNAIYQNETVNGAYKTATDFLIEQLDKSTLDRQAYEQIKQDLFNLLKA